MGRKKRDYRPEIKSYNCGNTLALEICKKKRINISAEITRMLERLAYGAENLKQAEILLLDKLNVLQKERDRTIKATENKYAAEIRGTAQDLAKIQAKIKQKELDEREM